MNIKNNDSKDSFESRAKSLKDEMVTLNLANHNLFKGCSEEEIVELERKFDIVLPKSYKIFMKNFGHSLGGVVMNDIEIRYHQIHSLTNILKNRVLIDDNDPILPNKAFVFAGRYDEQFMFFDASGLIKEPPIMYYMEYDENFKKIGNSIFDLLEYEIEASKYYKFGKK